MPARKSSMRKICDPLKYAAQLARTQRAAKLGVHETGPRPATSRINYQESRITHEVPPPPAPSHHGASTASPNRPPTGST